MPEVQDVPGARILIVWDGKRIEMRANVPAHVAVLMTAAAARLALDKFLGGPAGARDIASILRGES